MFLPRFGRGLARCFAAALGVKKGGEHGGEASGAARSAGDERRGGSGDNSGGVVPRGGMEEVWS